MSITSRLISGSAASWARIAVTMISQIAFVPIYLSYWDIETYGLWLAIQTFTSIMSTLDIGYQEFLGFEFLRLGKENRKELSNYLWSGISIGICLGIVQVIVIMCFLFMDVLPHIFKEIKIYDVNTVNIISTILLLQSFTWLISGSVGGLLVRSLAPFGYYSRMAWWGVFTSLVINVTPAISIFLGADLLIAGIILAITSLVMCIPQYIDMLHLLRKESIHFSQPSLKIGYEKFIQSLLISAKSLFENTRQQGIRIFLSPFSGAAGLAAFATMRTGVNISMQGLHTITNPMMPELMQFLHKRDQIRSEAAFGTVWIVVIAIIAPAIVLLQVIIEPIFLKWTRGQIPFNPALFALLSLSVLVYALAQPAIAVTVGNNLLKPQLYVSAIASIIAIGGLYILFPIIGILGAGVSLLSAEIVAAIGYIIIAQRWLNKAGLFWPKYSALIALASVCIVAIAVGIIVLLPNIKWLTLFISLFFLSWNVFRYWRTLPILVTDRVRSLVNVLRNTKFNVSDNI